ncbi:MAG: hypothetical protein VB035_00715 [Candidatus Fimivivens sp.]|nr:hypothetical protein [Candidatus Fimivivens sp.]
MPTISDLKNYRGVILEIKSLETSRPDWEADSQKAPIISRELDRLRTQRDAIESVVQAMSDARLRGIVRAKYMCGDTWENIAAALNLDYRWTLRLGERAAKMFAAVSQKIAA